MVIPYFVAWFSFYQTQPVTASESQPINPSAPGSSSSSLSGGAIAGIVIGSVVGGCLVIAVLIYCCFGSCCKKSDKYKKSQGTGEEPSRNERSELSVATGQDADAIHDIELQ